MSPTGQFSMSLDRPQIRATSDRVFRLERRLDGDGQRLLHHGVFLIPTLHDTALKPINCSGLGFTKTRTWRFKLLDGIQGPRGESRYHVLGNSTKLQTYKGWRAAPGWFESLIP